MSSTTAAMKKTNTTTKQSFFDAASGLSPAAAGNYSGGAVFIVIALSVLVLAKFYYDSSHRALANELLALTEAAAGRIDGDLHNTIRRPEQLGGEQYAAAIKPLVDIHNTFPKITYLYTMIERDGAAYFILDTAADARLETDKELEPSGVMEAYEYDEPDLAEWLAAMTAGTPYVDSELFTDEYGTFISGSVPFRDSDGNIAGWVGVDYDASVLAGLDRQVMLALSLSLSTGLLLSILIGLVARRLKRDGDRHLGERDEVEEALRESNARRKIQVADLRDREERLKDQGAEMVALLEDLAEAHAELERLADHDSLTGLPSMRLCQDRIDKALDAATRGNTQVSVMFLDLDGFKSVNDGLGHAAGDTVLQDVAGRLASTVRQMDTVARIGGDEFVIVMPDMDGKSGACEVAERAVKALAEPFYVNSDTVSIGASIGIAQFPTDGTTSEQLLRRADATMYQIKRQGKNNFRFFGATLPIELS